jgi:glycosyltransferase involved in cell wall biosynthesis
MTSSAAIELDPVSGRVDASPVLARVLHVINGEHYSGAERVQDILAARLPSHGFDAGLACVKPRLFPSMRQATDAPLYDLGMKGRIDLRPVKRLAELICEEGYALVHAHTPRTALVASLASRLVGVPMVYHLHSPAARDSTRRVRNWLNAWLEQLCLARAAAVIAVSESLARDTLARGFDADRLFVVPNGVARREPRGPRRSADRDWVLGAVALFRPRKGTEALLEALARLRAAGLSVRLRAVGGFETPRYENRLKHRATELGLAEAVEWVGFTRNVDDELRQMDLFVLPSFFGEGLPMVVLEAMAAGVPVVASRVEGVPEVIRDQRDGLLVEPGDADALAAAVRRFIGGQADWEAVRHSALARQSERFSDDAMAAGTARVYRHVLQLD